MEADDQNQAVTGLQLLLVLAATALLALFYVQSDDDFIPVLDHANLAFHEAGHLFFGILGKTTGLYGGTLGQLVFPVLVTVSFLRRGRVMAAALGMLWLCQNLINIARYMADARAQQLPLVGGGIHDWVVILSNHGLLSRDTQLAAWLVGLAWTGMLVVAAWLLRRWYVQD